MTNTINQRFCAVRDFSTTLVEPLTPEDCVIQSMPDVSPTRWHLAHTTWFYETFLLRQQPSYRVFDASFEMLFNSYYNSVGKPHPRPNRGMLSRPGLTEVLAYRQHVDQAVNRLLQREEFPAEMLQVLELGLHHEQQHQELILTDIKHVLGQNPLFPIYRSGEFDPVSPIAGKSDWAGFDEGLMEIGHANDGFRFDNECPRHRCFVPSFELAQRSVSNGDYLRFLRDGGYDRSECWLATGWDTVCRERWQAPLYWLERDNDWHEFTLAGLVPLRLQDPVCHVSYFEADAYARWAGMRLPTEAEWEVAAQTHPIGGHFAESLIAADLAVHPQPSGDGNVFGNVWEWTQSAYSPYPGYRPPDGALGEYNGKFMCNQYVLRGGSCATPSAEHLRPTYRNFFPPEARWQFSGIRLAR